MIAHRQHSLSISQNSYFGLTLASPPENIKKAGVSAPAWYMEMCDEDLDDPKLLKDLLRFLPRLPGQVGIIAGAPIELNGCNSS